MVAETRQTKLFATLLGAALLLVFVLCATLGYLFIWRPYQKAARTRGIINALGPEEFTEMGGVFYELGFDSTSAVTNLQFLREMPELRRLALPYAEIGDKDLANVALAPQLEELTLGRAFHDTGDDLVEYFHGSFAGLDLKTPEGMRGIRADIARRSVVLRNCAITSEGMKQLADSVSLKRLSLELTCVDSEGLRHLAVLPQLEELDLRLTKVDTAGIRYLRDFPALKRLDIGNNRYISGDALEWVAGIATLEELRPPYALSDDQMRELHDLKNLRVLDLRDSNVSAEAIEALEAALPECKVLRGEDSES